MSSRCFLNLARIQILIVLSALRIYFLRLGLKTARNRRNQSFLIYKNVIYIIIIYLINRSLRSSQLKKLEIIKMALSSAGVIWSWIIFIGPFLVILYASLRCLVMALLEV